MFNHIKLVDVNELVSKTAEFHFKHSELSSRTLLRLWLCSLKYYFVVYFDNFMIP